MAKVTKQQMEEALEQLLALAIENRITAQQWQDKQDEARARHRAVGWRRWVFRKRYEALRKEITDYGWERFKYTAMMMSCHRDVKRLRRALARLNA